MVGPLILCHVPARGVAQHEYTPLACSHRPKVLSFKRMLVGFDG